MNKRNLVLSIVLGSFLIAGVFSATYAYFAISQNTSSTDVQIVTGNTTLVLDDVDPITQTDKISANNTTITRYLTIRNDGSVDGYAKLLFKNLYNDFVTDDLVYSLEEVNSDKSSLTNPNIIVNNEVVPKNSSATNTELANGLLIPANSSKYYKLIIHYNYSATVNQNDDLGKVLTSGFIIEEGNKTVKNIYCVDESGNETNCPTSWTQGDRIAIGRETPQYFRYLRTTDASKQLAECGTTESVACADNTTGNLRFMAEHNLKRTGSASSSAAISSDALQDPKEGSKTNAVIFDNNTNIYNQSNLKIYLENYASLLNNIIKKTNAIKANAMSYPEIMSFNWGCPTSSSGTCSNIPRWADSSYYWLSSGTEAYYNYLWSIYRGFLGFNHHYNNSDGCGARPVIEFSPSIF